MSGGIGFGEPPDAFGVVCRQLFVAGTVPQARDKVWEEWFGFPVVRMVNGKYRLPDKPGLGFELTEDDLKKYPFEGKKEDKKVATGKGGPQPRVSSPVPGRSTLITSAPRSANVCVAIGPASTRVRSRTRIPCNGPGIFLCGRWSAQ